MTYMEWLNYKGVPKTPPMITMPGFKEFNSIQESIEYGLKEGDKLRDRLTNDEVNALYDYGILSNHQNGYMREGEAYFKGRNLSPATIEQIKKQVKDIESALDKAALSDNLVLFRGTNAQNLGINVSKLDDLIGKELKENAFMSTTGTKKVAETYADDVVLRIKAPQGTKGVFIDAFQDTTDFEWADFNAEYLLQRGQTMKITGYREATSEYGKKYYELDVDLVPKRKK